MTSRRMTDESFISRAEATEESLRLWAGWRHRYLSDLDTSDGGTPVSTRSVFLDILESGRPDDETLIVHRGATVFVILNLHPYSVGHSMVVPYREVARLSDLTSDEHDELWRTASRAVDLVSAEYSPQGVNVGLNIGRAAGGSVPRHLHVHVVPRWLGEGNFLAATARTRTLPEPLDVTAGRLRERWRSSTTA
jgi:ATP adenylyltransferase